MGDQGRPIGRPSRGVDRVSTAIRLPVDLHTRLVAAATERDVSTNWMVERLLTEGLDHLVPLEEIRLTRPPEERP